MKRKEKQKFETKEFHLPTYKEIPSVGLYLDQTSKYINEALEGLPGCSLTNSMISNYVKKDLIDNPVKKQYGRDQIAYLIFIAVSKSAISLDDADGLFAMQRDKYETRQAYEYFCDCFDRIYNRNEVLHLNDEQIEKRILENIVMTVTANIRLKELLSGVFGNGIQ